jgi:transcriptional regulator with XRE-family HTH domain
MTCSAPASLPDTALDDSPAPGEDNILIRVSENLRRLRTRNGLSLERLARASGVSRAMLSQIELARSSPSVTVLWKIARALEVPLSAFTTEHNRTDINVLRAHRARLVSSPGGRCTTRTLIPDPVSPRIDFLEMRLATRAIEEVEPQPPGTVESLVVARGSLDITIASERIRLDQGDAIQFVADRPHLYHNAGPTEVLFYRVVSRTDQG